MNNCYHNGSVNSYDVFSGGIIGHAAGCVISDCYNKGSVYSHDNLSGGIIGLVTSSIVTKVNNSYNTGEVSTNERISGGIIGGVDSGTVEITNCYNIGKISGASCGGIVSYGGNYGYSINVSNSYYLNTCGGNNTHGGEPMSSDAMKTQEFVEIINDGSCAWEYDYNNTNSGYPVLTMLFVDAVTSDVTHVTQTYATLRGSINTENTSVLLQGFEYKKVSDLHYQTVNVSGSGNISTTLSGLQPNTQYQHRTFLHPQ